jgi:hypothetical protein
MSPGAIAGNRGAPCKASFKGIFKLSAITLVVLSVNCGISILCGDHYGHNARCSSHPRRKCEQSEKGGLR